MIWGAPREALGLLKVAQAACGGTQKGGIDTEVFCEEGSSGSRTTFQRISGSLVLHSCYLFRAS